MANAPDKRPFDPGDCAELFGSFEASRGLLLAVSGGSDSLALLYLVARWRETHCPALACRVATVDHGLRPESADEARYVASIAARLNLSHHTLLWTGDKPTSNLQEAARKARYRLLRDAAAAFGADRIVTAHTRDDQSETFLLALARGSGVYGLAGMRSVRLHGDGLIARPLLSVSRERLRAHLRHEGIDWIEDPSNANERFQRVRVRGQMAGLATIGLSSERLAGTAMRLARAADALDHYAGRLIADACGFFLGGSVRIDVVPFLNEPEEVRLRALSRLLVAIDGSDHGPRLERLERLMAAIVEAIETGHGFQRTLGGVTVRLVIASGREPVVWLFAEAGRAGFPVLRVGPGETVEWDRRIRVSLSQQASQDVEIRALGTAARRLLGPHLRERAPGALLQSLPGLFRIDGPAIAGFGLQRTAGADEVAGLPAEIEGATIRSLVTERLFAHPADRFPVPM